MINLKTMNAQQTCNQCGGTNLYDFFHLPSVPTMDGVMEVSEEAALNAKKGTIDLRLCKTCSFINNTKHEPEKVSFKEYDFSNDYSPIFKQFVNELSDRLIEQYDLRGKTILDLGSGDGIFLKTICEKGGNKGIGIDPGFDHSESYSDNTNISFIHDYYSAAYKHLKADLITCRLVLTILDEQVAFMRMLRKNLDDQPETVVYFEVPNALYTFKDKVIWNVIYEHNTWYTADSLAFLFELTGFEVLQVTTCWNDEFLGIEARPRPASQEPNQSRTADTQNFTTIIEDFNASFQSTIENCKSKIKEIQESGIKTIAWGAGARGLSFFNLFDIKSLVPFIIDINPNRQGKYLPGGGQKIVEPNFAITYQPDLIIITNPTYEEEIKAHVHEMGLKPQFWVL